MRQIRVTGSCSFCHAMNAIETRFCAECGHEAHVARMDCQCPQCARPDPMPHARKETPAP